jgi:glycosyltransferase involved in cell wall biosynthesis
MMTGARPLSDLSLFAGCSSRAQTRSVWVVTDSAEWLRRQVNELEAGMSALYLARVLAANGHNVTLLFAASPELIGKGGWSQAQWSRALAGEKVRLVTLPGQSVWDYAAPKEEQRSAEVYELLRREQENIDVVHFYAERGVGYFSLVAKTLGLAFARTLLVVHADRLSVWAALEARGEFPALPHLLELHHMERRGLELADVLVTPTRHHLRRLRLEERLALPSEVIVAPPVVDQGTAQSRPVAPVQEIVLLMPLVGLAPSAAPALLDVALEALLRLQAPSLPVSRSEPAPAALSPMQASLYAWPRALLEWRLQRFLRTHAADWIWPPVRAAEGGLEELARNVSERGGVVVVVLGAAPHPTLLQRLLALSVPFLAADHPAARDLVSDPAYLYAASSAASLERALRRLLASSSHLAPAPPPARHPPAQQPALWARWHARRCLPPARPRAPPATRDWDADGDDDEELPLVSVVMTTYNRARYLQQAVESVAAQRYPAERLELILVDDGSHDAAAVAAQDELARTLLAERGWRLVRQENAYLGAARNRGAREARGRYLLFMDDDNVAKEDEVATFVRAARASGAHLLTCFIDSFRGEQGLSELRRDPPRARWLALGGAREAGLFRNRFGDANLFVERRAFLERLGGFSEERDAGYEDWELLARAALAGLHVEVVPDALFWKRLHASSMQGSMDKFRSELRPTRAYLEALAPGLSPLLLAARRWFSDAGDLRLLADSERDFAPFQGQHGWRFGARRMLDPPSAAAATTEDEEEAGELGEYVELAQVREGADGLEFVLEGVGQQQQQQQQLAVARRMMHPSARFGARTRWAAVRRWESPCRCGLLLRFELHKPGECGDGALVTITAGPWPAPGGPPRRVLWRALLRDAALLSDETLLEEGEPGLPIELAVAPLQDEYCDGVWISLRIFELPAAAS